MPANIALVLAGRCRPSPDPVAEGTSSDRHRDCATGATNKDVGDRLGLEAHTVSRWRARFVRDRLEGLTDEPVPGGPRKITDDQVEGVVVKTLETTPKDATRW